MALTEGDTLPDATLLTMGADGPEEVALSTKTTGKKVVIFGLPGAYTGTCTTSHVPSFVRTKDQFAAKGVDEIICVSVNDPFVMGAWGDSTGATAAGIAMLGDASAEFTKAIGMDFTAPPVGLYSRSKRYAMVVDNGVVTALGEEASPGECDISAGEALLERV
ncbi:MAG: peroxiredoxin [Pseudomonadota bacterium]